MRFSAFLTLTLILFFEFSGAKATPADSIKKEITIPTLINYINDSAFSSAHLIYHRLDTTIDNLETVNPARKYHYNFLSNIGSAPSSQVFTMQRDIFSDVGFHTYDLYLINENKIRYFKTNKAYSQIDYHFSGGKEQQITVRLSENIFKSWNIGLDFNRLGSEGFLKNGNTYTSNFDLYTWVHSVNNRYNLLAFACWNTVQNYVNGGIHNDSLYDHTVISNIALRGLLVNLTDAESHFHNRQFSLKQYYDLGFKTDDGTSDTLKKFHFFPTYRIEHAVSLEFRSFTYLDQTSGDYYKNSFFTPTTLDSLHFYDLRNRISLSTLGNSKKSPGDPSRFYGAIGWENQWLQYSQQSFDNLKFPDTTMHNNSLTGSISTQQDSGKIVFGLSGNYIFEGANQNNYKTDLSVNIPFEQLGAIQLSGQLFMKSPEYIYQRYYSNHFIWENNFENSTVKNFSMGYSIPKFNFSLAVEASSISNYIYLDSTAMPVQATTEIQTLKYELIKDFKFGKIHFNNEFIIQKVNEIIHLPSFISTQSLYYESFFYHSALLLQTGFDFHYHTSYYSDGFMPATSLFYIQDATKTGGYMLIDFFLNFRIKSARIFVKLENIGDGIVDNGYYLTPHYPMQGMTFQFGIKWRFFDQ